jgi:flavodoxin
MKYLVIYDSIFGNTEKIAQAIAGELSKTGHGSAIRVENANLEMLSGLDLLLAGSPTRAFQPTPAVKDFLKSLPGSVLKGMKAAAFDTRMDVKEVNNLILTVVAGIFGYAAGTIAGLLKRKGTLVLPPEGDFFVTGSEGPLHEGEMERAAQWAAQLAEGV